MDLQVGQIIEFQAKDLPLQLGVILAITPKGVRVLQVNRKETVIAERTIMHHTVHIKASPRDIDYCCEKAREHDEKRRRLASTIDLRELHELLYSDPRPYSLLEMASFLADPNDEDFAAALLRRLFSDNLYFRQRKEGFIPVPPDEVKLALENEQKRQREKAEEQALIDELKRANATCSLEGVPRVKAIIDSLVQIVLWGSDAQVPKRLHEVLESAALNNPRALYGFLVRIGRFHQDENLDLLRYKIPTTFTPELEAEATHLTSCPISPTVDHSISFPIILSSSTKRHDLRGMPTWAIDSESTRDRDDAFSLEADENGYTLWIHISDVAALIAPDSLLDREAARRGTTIYLPEGNIPMLPSSISENALSLNESGDRPALTWKIRLDKDGNIQSYEIFRSLIRLTKATDYRTADQQLETPLLDAGLQLAAKLRQRRQQAGALFIERQPEIKISLAPDGRVELSYRPTHSPTAEMIMEFMILANHLAARYCQEHALPCLYRTQEQAENLPQLPSEFQPVAFFQALRFFRKTVLTLTPAHHASLGIGPYCQVTSPLRRYCDLLIQRQLTSHLEQGRAIYDAESFQRALLISDEATRTADMVMQNRQEYWLLKFLNQQLAAGHSNWPGTVVDLSPNEATVYFEAICEFRSCRRPAHNIAVGQRVTIVVKKSDPFERQLRFEILP